MKKIALLVGCAALIGAFSITAPGPSWAKKCNAACQVEKQAAAADEAVKDEAVKSARKKKSSRSGKRVRR